MQNYKKSNRKILMGFAIIIVIIIIVALILNNKKKEEVDISNMTDEEISSMVQEKVNKMEIDELASLSERDRMERYAGYFIKNLEKKDYEKAYELLYDNFKKNYFPTLKSFEEYAKSKFPTTISVEYTNFERNGEVYVLWLVMSNPLASKDSGKEMNFVIQENDLNDFVMSFSVI